MLLVVQDEKGEIGRMSPEIISLSGYEREECERILKMRLDAFWQDFATPEKRLFTKGKISFPRKEGEEELLNLDLIIGRTGEEITRKVFILSPPEEGLNIPMIDALLNLWEEAVALEIEGVIVLANQTLGKSGGYEREELIGRDWKEIFIPGSGVKIFPFSEKESRAGELRKKDGSLLNGWIIFRKILGERENFFNLIIFRKEEKRGDEGLLSRALAFQKRKLLLLTEELKKKNEELQRLNSAKSEFVSTVSHDLRTPLTTIIEGIRLCEDGTLGEINPEQKRFLRLALAEANRLADFINNLLELSRIESGRIMVRKRRLRMEGVIEQVLTSLRKVAEGKGVSLFSRVSEGLPPVFADESHCRRILNNLLSNAIKFTPKGGRVEITADLDWEKSNLVFTIRDTGIGIPKKEQDKIFQRFCRIERKDKEIPPGTGLGLALCKELVEVNGGKIWFKSEEDKGSAFSFSLPVYSEEREFQDVLKWGKEEAKRRALPLAVFLTHPLIEESPETMEKIESLLGEAVSDYGSYRLLSAKGRILIFLILPAEKVYDFYLNFRNLFGERTLSRPGVIYLLLPPEEIDEDKILKMIEEKPPREEEEDEKENPDN
jgi:signal transduction histidine kinase